MNLPTLQPLQLTRLQCLWMLRKLRAVRDGVQLDKIAAEERIRGGRDGELGEAVRALDADLMIADEVIKLLWQSCGVDGK